MEDDNIGDIGNIAKVANIATAASTKVAYIICMSEAVYKAIEYLFAYTQSGHVSKLVK